MNKLLILNYHSIRNEDPKEIISANDIYSISKATFIAQMDFLKKNKIAVISLTDLDGSEIPQFSVAITFDDGNQSDHSIAFPLLKTYNFPAVFFPTISNINEENISWEQLLEISKNSFVLGSHGLNHKDMSSISDKEKINELRLSKEILEKRTGNNIDFFAAPFGRSNRALFQFAKEAGYKHLFTTTFKLNDISSARFILHRWSVKRTTTMREFENIIRRHPFFFFQKIISSKLKSIIITTLGTNFVNKLNLFIHKRDRKL